MVGVETPVIDGLISIGSVVCGQNFWATGRRLSDLGLEGRTREDVLRFVQEGSGFVTRD